MNHFIGLLFLALCIASVFALTTKEGRQEQWKYFLTLMGYLVLGSLVGGWLMALLP